MGVVYLAQDTKLDRQVAIKSIPPIMSKDEKVKARLKREAKLLASLNHPDIATIHDIIEGEKGVSYLVLEYIPGDTLADCIVRGPLPAKEVLSIGNQIADACASAHEHGIVHRDLKPANIKITKENRIKVLDFGIAKAVGGNDSNAYTTVTEAGQLIGTPTYMSPEQARGKSSDERCDIWSFGCVLYEMLTGRPPFEGETASDTLADVLSKEPEWEALPQSTPANVKVLIRRCLEKDPKQRLQHMGDVALEIRETVNLPAVVPPMTMSTMTVTQPATLSRGIITKVAALFFAAVFITSMICWKIFQASPPPPPVAAKLSIPLTPTEKPDLIYTGYTRLVLSPDGQRLVLQDATACEKPQLCARPIDSFEAKPIPGTENAYDPFFSPDGQWLAFFTQDAPDKHSLWKVRMNQHEDKILLKEGSPQFAGGNWSDDNIIFFSSYDENKVTTLFQISADGGIPEPLAKDESNSRKYQYPQVLPDGKTVICGKWREKYLLSLETGKSTVLFENATNVQYSATGHLLFTRDGRLFAVPFDVDTHKETGPERMVIGGILSSDFYGMSPFSIACTGTLAYVPIPSGKPSLIWVDPQGDTKPVAGAPEKNYHLPRLSPDETHLALRIDENETGVNLWKYNLSRNVFTQLTNMPGTLTLVCMSGWVPPDGQRISFSPGGGKDGHQLYWVSADGSGEPEPIVPINHDRFQVPYSWSPDGKYLAYHVGDKSENAVDSTWILPFGDDGKPGEPAFFDETTMCPVFRPSDGRGIAYYSDETGRGEIYIKQFLWGNLREG